MRILFTTSDYPASKLIRALTHERMSHCAIQIGDHVIHSSFLGVTKTHIDNFVMHNRVIASVPFTGKITEICNRANKLIGKPYDYGALLYIGARLILKKIGINLPKANLWGATGMFLCTEFVVSVIDLACIHGEPFADDLLTPGQLFEMIRKYA